MPFYAVTQSRVCQRAADMLDLIPHDCVGVRRTLPLFNVYCHQSGGALEAPLFLFCFPHEENTDYIHIPSVKVANYLDHNFQK